MIVQVRCCPALIVLMPISQSPERSVPISENTSIRKVPGSNMTNWLPETVNVRMSGWALALLIIITEGRAVAHAGMLQTNLTNRVHVVSGVTAVFGTPLLTLFAALWLHEPATGLSAPTVSQLAFWLVYCLRSLESAKTSGVSTFVVYIPDTNTVVDRINNTRLELKRFI